MDSIIPFYFCYIRLSTKVQEICGNADLNDFIMNESMHYRKVY